MAKNTRWTPDDFKKKGLIQVDGGAYVKASTQVATSKVEKIVPGEFTAPAANRKIKNAVKSEVDGVKFDSNLEKYMYGLLQGAGIDFEFQKVFVLQEKFRYGTENIRAITKICDFWLPGRNMIIDTKGFSNDVSPIKHKMLKWALKNNYNIEPEIILPANKKECDLLLNQLLYGTN